jgi:hypothetical protein
MVKRYNNLSLLYFVPGLIIQVAGLVLFNNTVSPQPLNILSAGLIIAGTLMAVTGFGYYAKAKGRSMFWGICGFIGFPGLLMLSTLKDRSGDPWNT